MWCGQMYVQAGPYLWLVFPWPKGGDTTERTDWLQQMFMPCHAYPLVNVYITMENHYF